MHSTPYTSLRMYLRFKSCIYYARKLGVFPGPLAVSRYASIYTRTRRLAANAETVRSYRLRWLRSARKHFASFFGPSKSVWALTMYSPRAIRALSFPQGWTFQGSDFILYGEGFRPLCGTLMKPSDLWTEETPAFAMQRRHIEFLGLLVPLGSVYKYPASMEAPQQPWPISSPLVCLIS